jgi:hypothetical protein
MLNTCYWWNSDLLRCVDSAEVNSTNVTWQCLINGVATVIIPNIQPFIASI